MNSPKRASTLRNTLYRRKTDSRRRMTRTRRAVYAVAAPAALAAVRFWWRSCPSMSVIGEERVHAALAREGSFLPCYWHQHQLFCARYLLQQRARGLRVGFLISPSVDGELAVRIVQRAGGHVIRGSSSHTGALALQQYFHALMREGISPVITPDGPRGPRFRCKPGAILLAQMSGRPILPMAYAATRAVKVHWDRFVIPLPLARIAIAIGPPLYVPRSLEAAGLPEMQAKVEHALGQAYALARTALQGARAQPAGAAEQPSGEK